MNCINLCLVLNREEKTEARWEFYIREVENWNGYENIQQRISRTSYDW